MPSKPFRTALRSFLSKKDATSYYREILSRYLPGERLSPEDTADLLALLEHHNEKKEKIGVGIDHLCTMISPEGTKCFAIVRKDGTKVDFSFYHCITRRSA